VKRNYGLYAVALAIVVVGALWAGLRIGTLGVFGLILVCPLMMFFMMRGMGGMHGGGAADERDPADPPAAPERPTSHDHGAMR
jgi:hypothetical protein